MKDIVIIGAGGVGREVIWIIEQINNKKETWNVKGFIDDNAKIWGKCINGYEVIGGREKLKELKDSIYVVVGITDYKIKSEIINFINGRYKFANIIHPDVFIANTVRMGEGVIIYPGVIITTNVEIGNHVIISPKCGVGHNSIIKDYVSILWNVNISGFDVIGEGCLIGSGATIIQNKNIGEKSVIGAGAVVVKDIDEDITVIGVPAKNIIK